MIRALLTALGLVELFVPGKLIAVMTRLAYEDSDEMTTEPWVTAVAYAEGAVLLLVALVGLRGWCDGDDDDA